MEQKDYRLAAIMYTDIVGFSRMMEKDETATLEMLRYHNALISRLSDQYKGRVIKTIGDAFLVDFPNTVNAVKCAVDIHNELARYNKETDLGREKLVLRIGVHLGDIYFFEDDALGEGINIASRLQSLAKPGRICISGDVYNLVHNKIDLKMNHLGEVKLKNISRGIHAYEIFTDSSSDDAPSGEGEKLDPNKIRLETEEMRRNAEKTEQEEKEEAAASSGKEESSSSEEESVDFKELKALVLQEIKRAGRRLSVEDIRRRLPFQSKNVDAVLNSLADKGFLTRLEKQNDGTAYAYFGAKAGPGGPAPPSGGKTGGGSFGSGLREELRDIRRQVREEIRRGQRRTQHHGSPAGDDRLVENYREHTALQAEKGKRGFMAHLASYLGVNGFLFFIWLSTSTAFPWFLFPLLGWGIGILNHFVNVKRKEQESRELETLPGMSTAQLKIFRKFQKNRDSFASHIASTFSTSVLLFTINMITSPVFPWFVFPVGGMAIGLLSHWPSFKSREKRILRELKAAGIEMGRTPLLPLFRKRGAGGRPAMVRVSSNQPVIDQAEQLKTAIQKQLKTFEKGNYPLGEDIASVLDNYLAQIKELDEKDAELEQIINSIPMGDLERDLSALKTKLEDIEEEKVRSEYLKSIEQIEKQKRSFSSLKNEKDIIHLRLNSAVNTLKQMQIDLARMKSISASGELPSVSMLKEKSGELSEYLDDLRDGYEELDTDG